METQQPKYQIHSNLVIPKDMMQNWQHMLTLMGNLFVVPAALIMRVHEQEIEIFARSDHKKNPYKSGSREKLQGKLYCERVMDIKKTLNIPNALKDPEWRNNPDIDINMISYLGMPLLWPDGKLFGTICILDDKENNYSTQQQDLMSEFKKLVMGDLALLFQSIQLKQEQELLQGVINRSQNAFIIFDENGKLLKLNDLARQLLGQTQNTACTQQTLQALFKVLPYPKRILKYFEMHPNEKFMTTEREITTTSKNKIFLQLQISKIQQEEHTFFAAEAKDISQEKTLYEHANTDNLTHLFNRRKFQADFQQESMRAKRYNTRLALLIYDIDNFKSINDKFGHAVGDQILQQITRAVAGHLRQVDLHYRWGGEEFTVLLPETDIAQATLVAQRICQSVAQHEFPEAGQVTLSIGVTQVQKQDNSAHVFSKMDKALYQAKRQGKNQVCVEP